MLLSSTSSNVYVLAMSARTISINIQDGLISSLSASVSPIKKTSSKPVSTTCFVVHFDYFVYLQATFSVHISRIGLQDCGDDSRARYTAARVGCARDVGDGGEPLQFSKGNT